MDAANILLQASYSRFWQMFMDKRSADTDNFFYKRQKAV
jgi:hypothetical protein